MAERQDAGHVLHLHIGELTRRALVYRPSRLSERPGLVLVLHGAIASADEVLRLTDFNAQADRLGWVVAHPQAHRRSIGGGPLGRDPALGSQVALHDPAFLRSEGTRCTLPRVEQ